MRHLLGINISGLGFVGLPRAAMGLLAEVFGLLLAIFSVYVAVVVALEPSRFLRAG